MNCPPLPSASKRPEAIDALRSKIRLRPRKRDVNFAPEPRSAQWGDRKRKVRVTADGLFEREDGAIKSLSAAACQITGARRSDPLLQ